MKPGVTKLGSRLRADAGPNRLGGVVLVVALLVTLAGCASQEGTTFEDQNYSPTSGGAFDPTTLKASDPRSLFVGSNFRKTFAIAEQKLGARAEIRTAELYPGQLALDVLSHGKDLSVAVQYNGEYGSKPGGPLSSTPSTFRLSALAGDIPAELTSRISSEAHVSRTQLKYMIVAPNPSAAGVLWMVYTPNTSVYFTASGGHGAIDEYKGATAAIRLR
jgi:hypothetical protein